MKDVEKLRRKIENANNKYDDLEKQLEGFYGLEEAGKEAEIIALEETVKSINEHARIYLEQMFEDPILVRLECIKDNGKKGIKLQLNTVVEYQGETYEDIEELSGGERQRCDMAYLLAVNDMLGSNILMLDECLNNLDSSINKEVLSLVRDMCGHKMIMVVSHEAVKGVFDSEVEISH